MVEFIVNYIVKRLEVLNPFGMPWIKLVLPLNVLKGLIIRMEEELPSYQILPPMLQSSHSYIKLLVIG